MKNKAIRLAAISALALGGLAAVSGTAGAIKAGAAVLSQEARQAAALGVPMPGDRLAGFGCEGSTRPLFSREESSFPACQAIEALDGPALWTWTAWDSQGLWVEMKPGLTLRACLRLEESDGRAYAATGCEKRAPVPSPVAGIAAALEADGCQVSQEAESLFVLDGCEMESSK